MITRAMVVSTSDIPDSALRGPAFEGFCLDTFILHSDRRFPTNRSEPLYGSHLPLCETTIGYWQRHVAGLPGRSYGGELRQYGKGVTVGVGVGVDGVTVGVGVGVGLVGSGVGVGEDGSGVGVGVEGSGVGEAGGTVGDGDGVGELPPVMAFQTARSGFIWTVGLTVETGGGSTLAMLSPPASNAVVPVGDT